MWYSGPRQALNHHRDFTLGVGRNWTAHPGSTTGFLVRGQASRTSAAVCSTCLFLVFRAFIPFHERGSGSSLLWDRAFRCIWAEEASSCRTLPKIFPRWVGHSPGWQLYRTSQPQWWDRRSKQPEWYIFVRFWKFWVARCIYFVLGLRRGSYGLNCLSFFCGIHVTIEENYSQLRAGLS